MMRQLRGKNLAILLVLVLSQLHTLFRNREVNVDWFIFSDIARRIDYFVLYICSYISKIILAYCIIFPKGINRYLKTYILILAILDLIHFFLTSSQGFTDFKLILALIFTQIAYKYIRYE